MKYYLTHWSTRELAKKTGLSHITISRIWRAFGMQLVQTACAEFGRKTTADVSDNRLHCIGKLTSFRGRVPGQSGNALDLHVPGVCWYTLIAGLLFIAGCGTSGSTVARSHEVLSPNEVKSREATLLKSCPAPVVPSRGAAGNLPIHVTRWGTTGPRVLIIHGNVQSGLPIGGGPRSFAKQKVLGERGWRLELPDRPGFGDSPSRGPDDQEADAAWIADMLSGGAHLWGHSFGGTEALLAAARRPEAVRSLVLIEPALWDLLEGDPLYRNRRDVEADLDTRDRAVRNAHSPGEYASMFLMSFQPGSGGAEERALRAAVSIVPGLGKKIGCALLQARYASDDEVRKAVATVAAAHIPVLVITGGWSPGRDAMGEVVARLTGGRHVIVRSPNHLVMASNPGEFNEVVESFMRGAEHSSARQQ